VTVILDIYSRTVLLSLHSYTENTKIAFILDKIKICHSSVRINEMSATGMV